MSAGELDYHYSRTNSQSEPRGYPSLADALTAMGARESAPACRRCGTAMLRRGLFAGVALRKRFLLQPAFPSHNIEHIDRTAIVSIEDSAGWLNDLPIAPAAQLLRLRTTVGMSNELFDVPEDALNQFACCVRVVKSNIIGDRVEIVKRGLRPDYFSHRAMRFLALA